jgi:hypothetical protein
MTQTLDLLESTTTGRQLVSKMRKEAAAEVLARRLDLVAQRASMEKSAAEEYPKLQASLQAAGDKVAAAAAALQDARAQYDRATAVCSSASFQHEGRRDVIDRELRKTAPEAIDKALAHLEEVREETRAALNSQGEGVGSARTRVGNGESVRRRIFAINEARVAIEALKLEALDDDVLATRIAAIFDGLPPVESVAMLIDLYHRAQELRAAIATPLKRAMGAFDGAGA